jgi:putative ABC transport system permease protein
MHQLVEAIIIALQAIWANKLRSLMTVLGNIVAVMSIVTVVSLINGMDTYVGDAIVSGVGADSFTVERTGITTTEEEIEQARNNPRVTTKEAEYIRQFSPLVSAVVARAESQGEVSYNQAMLEQATVIGVTRDYLYFSNFDVERGRMISQTEIDRYTPVVILGADVASRLFRGADPLDKTIRITGRQFRVVGVSEQRGSMGGRSQDEYVVIPLGNYQKIYGSQQSLNLMVKPKDPSLIGQAMDDAVVAMRTFRGLTPKERNDFGVFSSETIIDIYEQATNGIFAVLVGVVALSLVVGGIVIMNIMLMVVSERTREIGLRKALGAKRADVMAQILTESVTLSTIGGFVGIVLGFLAAQAMASFSPLPARLELWSVVLGLVITAAVGLFFGAYPAARAARLDPIEALRQE